MLWPESVTSLESKAFSIIPELDTSEDQSVQEFKEN